MLIGQRYGDMDQTLKQRLVGAAVLIALAVIFLPVFITGPQDAMDSADDEQIMVPPAPAEKLSSKRLPVMDDNASQPQQQPEPAPQWPIATTPLDTGETTADTLTEPAASSTAPDADDSDAQVAADDTDAAATSTAGSAGEDVAVSDSATDTAIAEIAEPAPGATTGSAGPEPEPLQLTADGPDPDQWYVQVASLGNPDNVRRLQQQLQAMSLQALTERVQRDDISLYRVIVGPYSDNQTAQAALDRIADSDQRLRPVLLTPESASAGAGDSDDATSAMPEGLDRYAVQVGVFSTRERSDEVVARLQNAGFAGYQETIERADENLYRVRIGPLLSETDGNNIAARIKRDLDLDSLVVDYR